MKKILILSLFILLPMAVFSESRVYGTVEHYFNGGNRDASNPYNFTSFELGVDSDLSADLSFHTMVEAEMTWVFDEGDSPAAANLALYGFRYHNSSLTVDLGRVNFQDSTGYILDLNLDGMKINYALTDTLSLRGGAGYSGMTFDHATDLVKTENESLEDDFLSPERLIGFLKGTYRNEAGWEVNAHFLGQTNFNGSDDPLLLWYAGAYASKAAGDFLMSLDYTYSGGKTSTVYLGDVYENDMTGHLLYGEIGYYPNSLRNRGVRFVLSGLYTSGDSYDVREENSPGAVSTVEPDGKSSLFIPISRTLIGSQLGEQAGNLAFGRIEGGFVPLKGRFDENLVGFTLGSSVYMRTANGPIQAYGLNSLSDSSYLGTEINGEVIFRPFSDLGLSIDNQIFLPDTSSDGAFAGSRDDLEYALEVVLSLSI